MIEQTERAEEDTVAFTVENRIAWVKYNRPEKRNCMSPKLNRQMMRVLDELEFREDVGVLVLTGEGDAFSAGMDLQEYFRVPVADQSIPSMSVWEFNKVKDVLRKEGAASEDKVGILRVLNDLRSQVAEAEARTKKARRMAQRRREHEKGISPAKPLAALPTSIPVQTFSALIDGDLTGFGDIA